MAVPGEVDLVLEGGGVKAIALVGAAAVLGETGTVLRRTAGVSAGAIVASVLAALQRAGEPLQRIDDVLGTLELARFTDPGLLGRYGGVVGKGIDLVLHDGVYTGEYLRQWLTGVLADLGVRTFGDLRLPPDPGGDLPEEHRYAVVVLASDLSERRLARFPWDYARYARDPDEMRVADAVRASTAIPYFFRPARLRTGDGGAVTLVDGGMLASFPIGIFDRTDRRPPRWPTFGVKLSPAGGPPGRAEPVDGVIGLGVAAIETMLDADDARFAESPCDLARTAFVDASAASPLDFHLSTAQQRALRDAGAAAMRRFLAEWDEQAYVAACRGGAV